jgi:hypothetical protein
VCVCLFVSAYVCSALPTDIIASNFHFLLDSTRKFSLDAITHVRGQGARDNEQLCGCMTIVLAVLCSMESVCKQ